MKYIDADKLIAEIESISLYPQKSADYNDGRDDIKMMVLDLIDSLQQEQPEVDLEKEIEKALDTLEVKDLRGWFRHFCELGKIAGAEWMKQQMLKGARDGYVSAIIIHNNGDEEHYAVTYPNGKRPHSITDKVKIIIL